MKINLFKKIDIPFGGFYQARTDREFRRIAQKMFGFGDIGQGMADVAGPEVPINGLTGFGLGFDLHDQAPDHLKQRIQCGAFPKGHVINLVQGIGVFGCGSEDVCLDET
jgi:hypothetical protein